MKPALVLVAALIASGCAPAADAGASLPPLHDGTATVKLGGKARFGNMSLTPLRIEEDSRCPTGVQCIQAGTVRLLVRIDARTSERETVLTLGKPIALEGGRWLALAAVCPYPRRPGRIARDLYRFTFAFRIQPPPDRIELPCA